MLRVSNYNQNDETNELNLCIFENAEKMNVNGSLGEILS